MKIEPVVCKTPGPIADVPPHIQSIHEILVGDALGETKYE
jgi:hypothetical protein